MDLFDDRFLVFVRADSAPHDAPEFNEQPLAACASYEEARRVKHDAVPGCVIRYMGATGGGD